MSSTQAPSVNRIGALLAIGALWAACAPSAGGTGPGTPGGPPGAGAQVDDRVPTVYDYRIVKTFPHDRKAYTQGLLWHEGHLYETTGRPNQSFLRKLELETGKVLQQAPIPDELFGEGLARWKGFFIQLTWEDEQAIVWDAKTFQALWRYTYEGEGWGLTVMGEELVMSDGSDELQLRDPETFELKRKLPVKIWNDQSEKYMEVEDLNELEYIDGEIWANLYQTEFIVRIDPETGYVTAVIDFSGLQAVQKVRDKVQDVQNGIAHDPKTGRLFITGKYWPNLYQIELVERER